MKNKKLLDSKYLELFKGINKWKEDNSLMDIMVIIDYGLKSLVNDFYCDLQGLNRVELSKMIEDIYNNKYYIEKPKYYIHLIKGKTGYININSNNIHLAIVSTKVESKNFRTQFTEEEIKSIDLRYWQFREKVED